MPHVLGFAGGGMNPRYINVGSNSNTQIGAGIIITPEGSIQTTGGGYTPQVGNARGVGATDLQTSRFSANHVASGLSSLIIGGAGNQAVGTYSGCINSNSGYASGTVAIVMGEYNQATGDNSMVLGSTGSARRPNELAFAGGGFSNSYNALTSLFVYRVETTNATPTDLVTSRTGTIGYVLLENDSTCLFMIHVVARRADADNESAGYRLEGVMDRNGTAASTALVGAVTKTVLAEDTVAWDVNVTADTTNGGIKITVTGEAAKTIRWVARVVLTEVSG